MFRPDSQATSMLQTPQVSVIMACHNGAAFLNAAIKSVQRQTETNIELLVIDDASTDETAAMVAAFAQRDARIRLIHLERNAGPAGARNAGLEAARGTWVGVVDADDYIHPDRFRILVDHAEASGADIIADDAMLFPATGEGPATILQSRRLRASTRVSAADYVAGNAIYRRHMPLGYLKPMFRRALLAKGVRYRETLRIGEDFHLVLDLLRTGARFEVLPSVYYFYRRHAGSISHRLSDGELQRLVEESQRLASGLGPDERMLRAALYRRVTQLVSAGGVARHLDHLKKGRVLTLAAALAARPAAVVPLIDIVRRKVGSLLAALRRPSVGRSGVVILTNQRIVGRRSGSSAYLLNFAEAVRTRGQHVHLLQCSPHAFGRRPVFRLAAEMDVFTTVAHHRAVRIGRWVASTDPRRYGAALAGLADRLALRLKLWRSPLTRPAPYAVAAPLTAADHAFIGRHVAGSVSTVIADYCFLSDAVPFALAPEARSAILMHDLFSSREAQFATLGVQDSVARLSREREVALLRSVDVVMAIQRSEADAIRAELPHGDVATTLMTVAPVVAPAVGEDGQVLFIGSAAAPNVDGMRWFLAEVWPIARRHLPGIALTVVGEVCTHLTETEGVQLIGPVDDLTPHYVRAGVVISPLRAGSGLKIKVVEAMGRGKAIVATPVSLQGLEHVAREAIACRETPAEFAAAVAALAADAQARADVAAAALAEARRHFSAQASFGPALDLLGLAGHLL